VGVQHHLGVADGAAGEVDQARVLRLGARAVPDGRGGIHGRVVADAVIGTVRARLVYDDGVLDSWAVVAHLGQLCGAGCVGDEGHGLGDLGAVLDVFGREQGGAGDADGAELHQPQVRLPPLRHARQHHQHAVALLDAELLEGVGDAAALLVEVDEGVTLLAAVRPDPEHRQLRGVFGPVADGGDGEVVVRWHLPGEVAPGLLVVGHVVLGLALSCALAGLVGLVGRHCRPRFARWPAGGGSMRRRWLRCHHLRALRVYAVPWMAATRARGRGMGQRRVAMLTAPVTIAVFAAFRFCARDAIRPNAEFKRICGPHELDVWCYERQKRQETARSGNEVARSAAKTARFWMQCGSIHVTISAVERGCGWSVCLTVCGCSGASGAGWRREHGTKIPCMGRCVKRVARGKRVRDQVRVACGTAVVGAAFTGCRTGSSIQKTLPLLPRRARTPIRP
jgi:hypothetical protein